VASSVMTSPASPVSAAGAPALTFEVISDPAQLRLLRPEWDALHARAPESLFTQSFAWCATGLDIMEDRRGRPIHCVTARDDGRLVLIWPFVVTRRGRWRIARHMGAGYFERDALLTTSDGERIVAQAWRHLKKRLNADFIEVWRVLEGSPAARAVERCERFYTRQSVRSAMAAWDGCLSWDDYLASRSHTYMKGLRRKRRRLGEQGKISFEMVSDTREFAELLAWTWRRKLEWMKHAGQDNPWIRRPDFVQFLETMQRRPEGKDRLLFFVMRLDGETIATELSLVNDRSVDCLVAAFDERLAKCSPGQLMQEDCMRWAFERRLAYDLGHGGEDYKMQWANREARATNYMVPLSGFGFAAVLKRKTLPRLTAILRRRPHAVATAR
jgi:CelD/BcsL family acetyltransferase involved in cellulose biosynthesis